MKKLLMLLLLLSAIFVLASCSLPTIGGGTTDGDNTNDCTHVDEDNNTLITSGESKKATCTEDGCTADRHCVKCGFIEVESEVIPKTGHTWTITPAVEATCLADGSTEGVKCGVCRKIQIPVQKIDKLEHQVVRSADVEATCTTPGYKGGTHCVKCLTSIDPPDEVIPPFGHERDSGSHIIIKTQGKEPTCTEAGLVANAWCVICNKEIITAKEIPATGHTPVVLDEDKGIAPTCNSVGYTDRVTCSVCKIELEPKTEIAIDPTAHPEASDTTRENVAAIAPTCHSDGYTAAEKCTACGNYTVEPELDTNRPEHIMADVEGTAVAADCGAETDGRTADRKCQNEDCEHLIEGEVIKFEHIWGEWTVEVEAEVGKEGIKNSECTVCHKPTTETIPALDDDDMPDHIDPDGAI